MNNKFLIGIVLVLTMANVSIAGTYEYFDNFINTAKEANWTPLEFGGTWTYPGDGTYTGKIGVQLPTVSSVSIPSWPDLTSTGISISANFTILTPPAGGEYNAGLFFGGNNPPGNTDPENVTVYSAGITRGPEDEAYVFVMESGSGIFYAGQLLGVEIDETFKLQIDVDLANQFSWDVDRWNGSGWVDVASAINAGTLPVLNGLTGVYSNGEARFTEFFVTGDPPAPVPINGTIHYSGDQMGEIYIGAANSDFSIVAETSISEPGTYSISVPPGTYLIGAQMDTNQSGSFDFQSFQQNEPSGHYNGGCGDGEDEDSIVAWSAPVQDIDVHLLDFKQSNILHESFSADYISGFGNDMGYHDGFLWVCDHTWPGNGTFDIHKVNPANGNLVDSFDLGIFNVTSLEWIGEDLWVCFKDWDQPSPSWKIRKYIFDGTTFTPVISYDLPSSGDGDSVWSINIAWDGSLLWAQEKGHWATIYKVDISDGSIDETIPCDQFELNKKVGLADIADICFSDGYLWAMDDGYPLFVQIDPVSSQSINYTFDLDIDSFEEDAKYKGMVKHDNLFYFLQRIDIEDDGGNVVDQNYKILTASLDLCLFKTITLTDFAASFGRTDYDQSGAYEGDGNFDGDVDGLDLWDVLSCQE